jgi:hypothetical protein
MSDHGQAHATLSPSSAERWISCPASVRVIAALDRVDDSGSVYAAEGTRAHTLAEIEAAHSFGLTTTAEYNVRRSAWLEEAERHGDDVEEMDRHVVVYVRLLHSLAAEHDGPVTLLLEQRVQTGVPGSWGTGDAILVSATHLDVVDFKYGQGITVRVQNNPQLMLYGLGSLDLVDGLVGDIETVGTHICQPRVGSVSHDIMSVQDLRDWRDTVAIPAARATERPDAPFGPSDEACRWCPAAGICDARMRFVTQRDFSVSVDTMSMEDLADAVRQIDGIRDWCNAVEKEALYQAYSEQRPLPGLKVVRSGGRRSIPNQAAAIERLLDAGYTKEEISRASLKTLKDLDRLVGKTKLPEVLGDLLVNSEGSPSLVPEDDSREAITSLTEAAKDFSPHGD